ncbi:hypothetical protein CTU88_32525 [Streptomyces sp. JV178]|uniref:helix-turn-helix domain-containing protein n=1 Tax=Streptomyces sp. JV178 TaxID=858632 RepID=UPI000C1B0709|nr:hypothetical protein CTU88_32525 [Streptomyces sp. JV178]
MTGCCCCSGRSSGSTSPPNCSPTRSRRAGVTDIAYAVGFRDDSHFARAFKSRHCVSPREYRRDHSAAPQGPGA